MAVFKKRVLCIGDSNTWGYTPITGDRYDDNSRWTRVLANELGSQYEVIEEGLNGRTTGFDDEGEDWLGKGRNCLKNLRSIVNSQLPLNIVVIMLGTNDLKAKFNADATIIKTNLMKIFEGITQFGQYQGKSPLVIVSTVSDIHPQAGHIWPDFSGREYLVQDLNNQIMQLNHPVIIFDGNKYTKENSEDGLHFTIASHRAFGVALAKLIASVTTL